LERSAQALFLRDGSARVVIGSVTGEQTTSRLFGGSLMVTRGAGQIEPPSTTTLRGKSSFASPAVGSSVAQPATAHSSTENVGCM